MDEFDEGPQGKYEGQDREEQKNTKNKNMKKKKV